MENSTPFRVAYIATPPADSLTEEAFRQQVAAQVQQAGSSLVASTCITHHPAHALPSGAQAAALSYYNVQVRDMGQATAWRPFGTLCFVAEAETAAECLAVLATKLSERAHRALALAA